MTGASLLGSTSWLAGSVASSSRDRFVFSRDVAGSATPEAPEDQRVWAASDSGSGIREITWVVEPGEWTVVVMNADGSGGIDTVVQAGIEAPWVAPVVATFVLLSAGMLLVGIALTIVAVFRWGSGRPATFVPRTGPYPVTLTGKLRGTPSRGLWLVKWVLALPHWIVLGVLWVALVITTVAAGLAVLFTGPYPRPIFDFHVGVLRWSWRVSFYS